MKRLIKQNCIVPKGYGIAYYLMNQDIKVCFPIPINILVSLFKRFHYWLAFGYKPWKE